MRILRAMMLAIGVFMLLTLAACGSAVTITVAPTATATAVPPGATTVPHPVGPPITRPLVALSMFTTINGWGAAAGVTGNSPQHLAYTADGGHSWVDVTPDGLKIPNGDSLTYYARSLTDAWVFVSSIGAGSSTTLWHTTDAGTTWNSFTVATTGVNQITFVDAQNGWLAASPGGAGASQAPIDVWRTTNGGTTWTKVAKAPPVSGDTTGISFVTTTTGFAAAGVPGALLTLAVTHDSGATWSPVTLLPPASDFAAASQTIVMPPIFTSPTTGALSVEYWSDPAKAKLVMYRTNDAGATWDFSSVIATKANATGAIAVAPLSVIPDGTIFAAPFTTTGIALVKLNPLSATWTPIATSPTAAGLLQQLTTLDMLTPTTGWAISLFGVIGTTDGGVTWTKLFAGA